MEDCRCSWTFAKVTNPNITKVWLNHHVLFTYQIKAIVPLILSKKIGIWLSKLIELASSSLGVVYSMDHKVVPSSSKTCDWLLNSSKDHFGVHEEKYVRVIMEPEVTKRPIHRPTLSIVMVQRVLQWERHKRYSRCKCQGIMADKYHFNI